MTDKPRRWLLRGARLDKDQSSEWVEAPAEDEGRRADVPAMKARQDGGEQEARRLRGNQDYKTLHLGKGTRWATGHGGRGSGR